MKNIQFFIKMVLKEWCQTQFAVSISANYSHAFKITTTVGEKLKLNLCREAQQLNSDYQGKLCGFWEALKALIPNNLPFMGKRLCTFYSSVEYYFVFSKRRGTSLSIPQQSPHILLQAADSWERMPQKLKPALQQALLYAKLFRVTLTTSIETSEIFPCSAGSGCVCTDRQWGAGGAELRRKTLGAQDSLLTWYAFLKT